ncbi:MAG: TolC family protein [Prevotella sp.]|nr:TolC family protein [Prevotella sp.]
MSGKSIKDKIFTFADKIQQIQTMLSKTVKLSLLLSVVLLLTAADAEARKWTLAECIDYALKNNITLQKLLIAKQSATEDVLFSKAALQPTLTAQTTQTGGVQPFVTSERSAIANGYVESSVDKFYYNGSYSLNFNWTVWNGNRNRNQIKLDQLAEKQADLEAEATANSIQEQIAQLYVQILYSAEAIDVSRQSLATSTKNEERGKVMVEVGQMSRAELSQLTAQRAQDEYNIVASQANLQNYKRQLKELLELTDDEEFDVVAPAAVKGDALRQIPAFQAVYEQALATRPELKAQQIAIEESDISLKIAKAQRLPTIGINSSLLTNMTTMSATKWSRQLKDNINLSAGVTVSVPILDNRQAKTAVNKAMLAHQNSLLELKNQQTQLYSTIESYWIQAVTNQAKYRAALVNSESQKASYEMLSEQFQVGLKNIVELMNGKNNLLAAQQSELESKYLTILNIQMLNFYQGKPFTEE